MRRKLKPLAIPILLVMLLMQTGCSPTYPKEKIAKSLTEICKAEQGLDVKAQVRGKTIGAYVALEGMFDEGFNISKEMNYKLGNVLVAISRVVLSSDADMRFYVLIAQDSKMPEIELIIIGSVEDFRRAEYQSISPGEYFERRLKKIKFTPQFKTAENIRELFIALGFDAKLTEELIADYFGKTEAEHVDDIGYWDERFYLKDIQMGEFLAEQMEERIRSVFQSGDELQGKFNLKAVNVEYRSINSGAAFMFTVDSKNPSAIQENLVLERILKIITDVMHGYKFEDFNSVEIMIEAPAAKRLSINKLSLEEFRQGKLGIAELLSIPAARY